jgi:hypothetical protein
MDKNKNGYSHIEETCYRRVGPIMNNSSAHGGNGRSEPCARIKIDSMGVHEKEDPI